MSSPLNASSKKKIRSRTRAIRRAIEAMDFVSSGTLLSRTKVCGRPNCRCATDPDARHGPYYEWNRRQDGRLVHKQLTGDQAALAARAIANLREVQRLLSEWETATVEEIVASGRTKERG
jgi:hypothetical protein